MTLSMFKSGATRSERFTDHKPLVGLFANTLPPGRLGRWALLIQAYNITIRYKPGVLNKVSDCLSRYPLPHRVDDPVTDVGTIQTIATRQRSSKQPKPAWSIQRLVEKQKEDTTFGPIHRYCSSNQPGKPPQIPRGLSLSNFKVLILKIRQPEFIWVLTHLA